MESAMGTFVHGILSTLSNAEGNKNSIVSFLFKNWRILIENWQKSIVLEFNKFSKQAF